MTKKEFKKRSKENKVSLLNVLLDETWRGMFPIMSKNESGKFSEETMNEIYALFSEFKKKIDRYN